MVLNSSYSANLGDIKEMQGVELTYVNVKLEKGDTGNSLYINNI